MPTPISKIRRVTFHGTLFMTAMVASEDGRKILRADASGSPDDAEAIGYGLAELLLERGAETVTALQPSRWSR